MTSRFAVVIPSPQETNILSNPSFETNTTGWTAVGATLARDTTVQKRGLASLKITPTSGVNDGAYASMTTTVAQHGFGVDVLGALGIPYLIRWTDSSGNLLGTAVTFTGTGKWQRVWVGWNESSATTRRVYVSKNNHASTAPFWIDGAKASAEAAESTYFDGDTIGFYSGDYYWLGAAHASQSVRKGYIRHGGRIADFETEFGFLVEGHMGFGLSKIANILLPLALVGGAVFQRQVPQERTAAVVGTFFGDSTQDLQQKRQRLISAVSPAPYGRDEPVMLLYRAGDGTSTQHYLEIPVLYAGGLEGGTIKGMAEKAGVQFTLYLPYISRQGNSAAVLDWQDTHTSAYISQRSAAGLWSAMGSGANNFVRCFAFGPDGSIYAGGDFTSMGGVANTAYIAKWNGSAWSALGTGMNARVRALAFGPDGSLYAGGEFTSASGVANTAYIAKWNGSAWSALGTGMNGGVFGLAFGSDGLLYAGGAFTLASGVANTVYIAKWNGSAWSALGTGMNAGGVTTVRLGSDGYIYAGGAFTLAGGVSNTAYIAGWNGSAWFALGTGANNTVYDMAVGLDGSIYAGGNFTSMGGVANTAYIAKWNGSAWSALGTGLNAVLNKMYYDSNGSIFAQGSFTLAGSLTVHYLAKWNGSAWSYGYDYISPSGTYSFGEQNGVRVTGISSSGTATTNGVTVVNNTGTLTAHPVIVFTGPGKVYSIRNLTTGADIDFNLTLAAGETATLDTTPGAISFVSSMRGNILGAIIPGSETASFNLAVGANNITAFIAGTTDANTAAIMTWAETHAAIDGGSQ